MTDTVLICTYWCQHEVWIVIWESSQELYALNPYRCKVEQPDALQHNGMTNSEREICKEICEEDLEASSLEK